MATEIITPLSADSLDLEAIKENLKQDLIDNGVLDVNYEGSTSSLLTQIISYAVQSINSTIAMNANQTNLILSDVRQNIIQEAQAIGYNITRLISSKIQVQITPDENLNIPKNTIFEAGDFEFLSQEDLNLVSGVPTTTTLIEGEFIDYNVDSSLKFYPSSIIKSHILPYTNVEENNLNIQVNRNGSGYVTYTKVNTLFDLDLVSNSFFTKLNPETEFVEIFFSYLSSDNKLTTQDEVQISFIYSSGSEANGLSEVTSDKKITIVPSGVSYGGADLEDSVSIKNNAPTFNNTGNRTVNEIDYQSFLEKNSLIDKATAWGGDRHFPKKLGYTYLSLIPSQGRYYSVGDESVLINYLAKNRIIGTGKIFKQPNYFPVNINIKVLGTVTDIDTKKANIETNLQEYFENISEFSSYFFESKVTRIIEETFELNLDNSVRVTLSPTLRLDEEIFTTGETTDIFIPNSKIENYFEKDGIFVKIPNNAQDIESYMINGWTRVKQHEEEITFNFFGTLNSKEISLSSSVDGVVTIDEVDYDYYDVLLDAVVIGKWIEEIEILRLDDLTSELQGDDIMNISFSPQMNVVSDKSSIFELGTITYD